MFDFKAIPTSFVLADSKGNLAESLANWEFYICKWILDNSILIRACNNCGNLIIQ